MNPAAPVTTTFTMPPSSWSVAKDLRGALALRFAGPTSAVTVAPPVGSTNAARKSRQCGSVRSRAALARMRSAARVMDARIGLCPAHVGVGPCYFADVAFDAVVRLEGQRAFGGLVASGTFVQQRPDAERKSLGRRRDKDTRPLVEYLRVAGNVRRHNGATRSQVREDLERRVASPFSRRHQHVGRHEAGRDQGGRHRADEPDAVLPARVCPPAAAAL